MFKRYTNKNVSKSVLISTQDIQWTRQHVLALSSQLLVMLLSIVILTVLLLKLGERRLQEDWADKRYSELQTVGTLASDKINFLQFRTQAFAKSELMKQYLANPSKAQRYKLEDNWDILLNNIPELLGLTLFDPQGNPRISSTDAFSNVTIPEFILEASKTMGGSDTYYSNIQFVPINGKLTPYVYQLARLENNDQSIRGYLVTYNSVSEILESIKPAFFNHNSPLLLIGSKGVLYAGGNQQYPMKRLPNTLGSSIIQSYPELWQHMANTHFGQFHTDSGTFVFLKVEVAPQDEDVREYYLLSYIRHEDIAEKFDHWRYMLICFSLIITALASSLLVLKHRFYLESTANSNSINLASALFNSNQNCLIVNTSGRIIKANLQAANTLSTNIELLVERSLQRVLPLEEAQYNQLTEAMCDNVTWKQVINLNNDSCTISLCCQPSYKNKHSEQYWLVTFENITELTQAKHQAYRYQLLSESAVATALTDSSGQLLKYNLKFKNLMALAADSNVNILSLLGKDITKQWADINSRISLQGKWKGQVIACSETPFATSLKANIRSEHSVDGEHEYFICTFEDLLPQTALKQLPNQQTPLSSMVLQLSELELHFSTLTESSREQTCLLIMDINPEGLISHISDIDHLEQRQKDIEMQLLIDLPTGFQIAHWRLGSLVILLPLSDSIQAHKYAMSIMDRLEQNELNEGINIGISGYLEQQSFEHYLSNAEVALSRAKQTGNQNICQAFTRKAR
ncbi:PAS domain-containing protein [Shewanella sp. UCD-KL21]|uniref:PAS domain-containing protein n=1 Tax=Shewanella sp. UCD-KL21 TaxID=1917164 RepID=UPI000970D5FE|nr:PAS domain-containing protein [Shewanella sp. UCD-KL21]